MKSSLNHIYRSIWSEALNAWVAVSELTSAKGKRSGSSILNSVTREDGINAISASRKIRLKPIALALAYCFTFNAAQANPIGAQVVNGTAAINQSGNTLTVTNSPNAIINWQGFSINTGETTRFNQQSASSAVLNRVLGADPSQLLGTLTSNGKVFLVNPAGILVGQGARIDVAGFVASTLNISNSDFLAGKLNFTSSNSPLPLGEGLGERVINNGTITTSEGGTVYLVAPQVENNGIINTPKGETILAAGNTVQLVDTGTPGVTVQVTGTDNNATNLGQILADSGRIGMVGAMVNNSGTISASSLVSEGGRVFLRATNRVEAGGTISAQGVDGGNIAVLADMENGTVDVTGTLDVSVLFPPPGSGGGGNGGFIETSAAHVQVADTAHITTAAPNGKSGTWLIDPTDFTIAAIGGDMTGAALTTALDPTTGGNVTIQSTSGTTGTAGDVNVNDAVTWSANKLTLNAQNNINVNANLNGSGSASLALEYGQVSAGGGTSTYNVNAAVNLPAGNNFSTKLGSTGAVKNYTVITSLGAAGSTTAADLQGMNGNVASNYALGANIDATATSTWNAGAGFVPVGDATTNFTGTFDGLGHTVSNLYINTTTNVYVGLFGYAATSSIVRDVGLAGGSIMRGGVVGGLVGENYGTVSNVYSTVAVNGSLVGGLVGLNRGKVGNVYSSGSVRGTAFVGGLVGYNAGSISNAYSTSSVNGVYDAYTSSIWVGGLAGANAEGGTILNAYSAGAINSIASSTIGGLVGSNSVNNGGTITNGYWDTITTGKMTGIGGGANLTGATGLTTAQMMTQASFTGFDFANTWWMSEGNTRPFLRSEHSTTITNAHQLQLMAMDLGAHYTLGANISMAELANPSGMWDTTKGFAPVGTYIGSGCVGCFTGAFDGLGHTITGLTINRPATSDVGLFGDTNNAAISNVGLVGGSITGLAYVGGLAGVNGGIGTITNSYSTATVNMVAGGTDGGGLVGDNIGTITNSYSTGAVTGAASTVGGLVGSNFGTITNSHSTGNASGTYSVGGLVGYNWSGTTITNSYSTGVVTGSSSEVGGLVGYNRSGPITNSYSTGSVSGTANVGGLVGYNGNSAITNSYSTGAVSGTSSVGGLVGDNEATISNAYSTGAVNGTSYYVGGLVGFNGWTITNSYWDTQASGTSTGIGGGTLTGATGLTTAQMITQTTFTGAGWNFTNTWGIIEGISYPYLQWRFPTAPQIVSGTLIGGAGGNTIQTAQDGNLLTTASTGANGFYYQTLDAGSVASGHTLLSYLIGGGSRAAAARLSDGNSLTGVDLTPNALTVSSNSSAAVSNTNLATAKGNLDIYSVNIPYNVTGTNLALSSGVTFQTASGTNYTLDGDVSTAADQIWNGSVTMVADAFLRAGGSITSNASITNTGTGSLAMDTGVASGNIIINAPIHMYGGAIRLSTNSAGGTITNNSTITSGVTGGASPALGAYLSSDIMNLTGGTITATGGVVVLQSSPNAPAIDLGATVKNVPGTLGISQADLAKISASTIDIRGNGGLTVSAAITDPNIGAIGYCPSGSCFGAFNLSSGAGSLIINAPVSLAQGTLSLWGPTIINNSTISLGPNNTNWIHLGADRMVLSGSGHTITATATSSNNDAGVELMALTAGTAIDLGAANTGTPGILQLSDADLASISTNWLSISRAYGSAGNLITVSSALTPRAAGGLELYAGTGMIRVNSGSSISLNPATADAITLIADKMDLQGTISAPAGIVHLSPATLTNAVNLGSAVDTTANTLELSAAELATVNALYLAIGGNGYFSPQFNPLTGAITVSAPVNTPNVGTTYLANSLGGIIINSVLTAGTGGAGALYLFADGSRLSGNNIGAPTLIPGAAAGTISDAGGVSGVKAGLLTTRSSGGTTLTGSGNAVTSFKATNTTSGNIALTNTANQLTITGISNTGGGNDAVSNTGAITTNGNVNVSGSLILSAASDLTLNASVFSGGSLSLLAGNAITLNPGTPIGPTYITHNTSWGTFTNTYLGSYTSGGDLTLLAGGAINLHADLGVTGNGNTLMIAGWNGNTSTPGVVGYAAGKNITTSGTIFSAGSGNMTLAAADAINITPTGGNTWFAGVDMNSGTLGMSADKIYLTALGNNNNGQSYSARISSNGDQNFTLTGGSGATSKLALYGANGAGAWGGQANIERFGGSGGQNFTFNNGSSLEVKGGSGGGFIPARTWGGNCDGYFGVLCSSNHAIIENQAAGGQTFAFSSGGNLTVTGGSVGNNNFAAISNKIGAQTVSGNPVITLTGGSSGGAVYYNNGTDPWVGADMNIGDSYLDNAAGLDSRDSQIINAASITLQGGLISGVGYGSVYIGSSAQTITTTGNLTLIGGTADAPAAFTNVASSEKIYTTGAFIGNDVNAAPHLTVGGNLILTGGAVSSFGGSPAMIGSLFNSADVIINATGYISMASAWINAGAGNINLTAGGKITEGAGGSISTAGTLTTSAVGGTTLAGGNASPATLAATGANAVARFVATDTSDIVLTNTAPTLTLGSITAGGTLLVNNYGNLTVASPIAINGTGVPAGLPADVLVSGGLSALGMLTNNSTITLATGSKGLYLTADKMTLAGGGGSISAPGSIVILNTNNTSDLTDLGSTLKTTPNTLELSQADLDTISSPNLMVVVNNNLKITAPISVGTKTLYLNTNGSNAGATNPSGTIAETGSGSITAGALITNSVGGTTLNGANAVSSFGATDTGSVSLTNTAVTLGLNAITSAGLTVNNTGAISITKAINAGAGAVKLVSGNGGIDSNLGAGLITANTLEVISAGNVMLAGNNLVNTLAANITSGTFDFESAVAAGLTIGTTGTTTGVTAFGNIAIRQYTAGGILVNQNVTSSAGNVLLGIASGAGTATIANTSAVSGNNIQVYTSGGDINFGGVMNGVNTLTVQAPGGTINANGNVSAGTFTLSGGTWNQVAATLPGFTVNDFRIAGGTFIRALGGNGTAGTPYQLADIYGVQGMGSAGMSGNAYVLANNIDATGTVNWNAGAGFAPVGNNWNTPFIGTFDGANHTISGLIINRPATSFVGLFGNTGSGSVVRNIGLVGGAVSGSYYVGGLVGVNNGTVSNAYSTGAVSGTSEVGGLVGVNNGTVSNAYSTGAVSGSYYVGGLVGYNSGSISNAYASGNVTGTSDVGGLAGYNYGSISNAHYDIDNVLINAGHYVTLGGLYTTQYQDWLTHSLTLDIANYSGAGGSLALVGSTYTINGVQGMKDLLGFADNSAYSFKLTNNINLASTPGLYIPNLAGSFDGDVYTIANLTINLPFTNSVGLFGHVVSSGTVRNVSLSGVSVVGNRYVGGLVGYNDGTVSNSSVAGSVTGSYETGGLVGKNSYSGTITNAYASGNVTGNSEAGGLVGYNSGSISNAYASGNVTGSYETGGLVGGNSYSGTITNTYATGSVTGNNEAGGLAGESYGNISYSYATGHVICQYPCGEGGGGLAGGGDYGTVSNSYWDVQTTGWTTSFGSNSTEGKTTAEMMTMASFSGWNIANTGGAGATWRIYEGSTTPLLTSFLKPLTVTANAATKTYDGLAYSGGNGVTYSDVNAVLSGTVAYGGTSQGAVNAGGYIIAPSGLYSNQQGYDISYANGALTINPLAVNIAIALAGNKVYDGTPTFSTGQLGISNIVRGDVVSLSAGTADTADKNVGVNKPFVSFAGLALTGASAGNYTLTGVSGTGTITPAALTITANAASKTYDGLAYSGGNGVTYSGLVNGETNSVLGGTLAYGGNSQGAVYVGSYTITPGGLTSGNYSINFTDGALTVNPGTPPPPPVSQPVTPTPIAITYPINPVVDPVVVAPAPIASIGGTAGTFGGVDTSVENIQAQIASGGDPTQVAPASASGNSGNGNVAKEDGTKSNDTAKKDDPKNNDAAKKKNEKPGKC